MCYRDTADSRRIDRSIDAEEEEYFNGDDDECDAAPPFISSALASRAGAGSSLNTFKRRRRVLVPPSKLPRPQGLVLPRTPALPSLLDYGDDDEEITRASPPETSSPVTPSRVFSKDSSPTPLSPSIDVPPSPRLVHRQIPRPSSIPRRRSHEEDDNLESLLRQKGSTSSPKPNPKPQLPPIRLSEKRRRENDDEDEILERLASKPKRTDLGAQKRGEPVSGRAPAMKPDDPPRRMKVMFRPLGMAVAQSTLPVPPDPGAKDGDMG